MNLTVLTRLMKTYLNHNKCYFKGKWKPTLATGLVAMAFFQLKDPEKSSESFIQNNESSCDNKGYSESKQQDCLESATTPINDILNETAKEFFYSPHDIESYFSTNKSLIADFPTNSNKENQTVAVNVPDSFPIEISQANQSDDVTEDFTVPNSKQWDNLIESVKSQVSASMITLTTILNNYSTILDQLDSLNAEYTSRLLPLESSSASNFQTAILDNRVSRRDLEEFLNVLEVAGGVALKALDSVIQCALSLISPDDLKEALLCRCVSEERLQGLTALRHEMSQKFKLQEAKSMADCANPSLLDTLTQPL